MLRNDNWGYWDIPPVTRKEQMAYRYHNYAAKSFEQSETTMTEWVSELHEKQGWYWLMRAEGMIE